jgi:hypothetical protein
MSVQSATANSENFEDSYEAGKELAEAISDKLELRKGKIGLLYSTMEFDLPELLRGVREHIDLPLVGCTTYSQATEEGYCEEAATLLVLTSDDLEVGIGLGEGLSRDMEAAVTKACDTARRGLSGEPRLILTFPDVALTPTVSAEAVLGILHQRFPGVPIAGGLPGDSGKFQKTHQFYGGEVHSDAIPVILLGGDIHPVVMIGSGWIPTGTPATATKVERNVLAEIDHRPAIEYIGKYIPSQRLSDPEVLGTWPLAVYDARLSSISEKYKDYAVMRSPFQYDKETGGIVYAGEIPPGAPVRLAKGSREDVIHGVTDVTQRLKAHLGDRDISCLMFFSCGGRKLVLGMKTPQELQTLRGLLPKDTPICGLYVYGEIAPIDSTDPHLDQVRFHNTTLVLCAL